MLGLRSLWMEQRRSVNALMIRRVFISIVSPNQRIRGSGGGLDAINGRSTFRFEEMISWCSSDVFPPVCSLDQKLEGVT